MAVDFLRIFKALGDETRLRIVNLLLQCETSLCVCEMTDALMLPQYHVSRHLMILKNSGLVEAERDGTWIYYNISKDLTECVNDVLKVIRKHFIKNYNEDMRRITRRLVKREADRCVIGFVQSEKQS